MPVLHDVLRLQIPVDDADAVRRFQGQAHLPDDLHGFFGRKLAVVQQKLANIASFDILHGDKFHTIDFRQVVDANHVSVGHLPRRQQFLLESRKNHRVRRHLGSNQLQRDKMFHFPVERLVNRAHASLAEQGQNLKSPAEHVPRLKLIPF